uniref:SAC/GANP domaincontaining protein putative n=1 Tax=Albugo laibachii Nc14 TaxID=890382 RepID=F0W8Y1_9STRA|nr:SAC/GANP domaincontaining protein putative [Albugo laibachii Nc14]|eukprot:CCA17592.1 SAC/GANP domaincontaining protein putative [Albugo laibachii Nc14]
MQEENARKNGVYRYEQSIRGTCLKMCPEAEYIARKRDNQLSRFEKITKSDGEIQYVALKAYRRPAAGRTDILLHELRPPPILLDTLRHLFSKILQWQNGGFDAPFPRNIIMEDTFLSLYNFIHDRIRSVRQDFTIQRITDTAYTTAMERIIRFYILSSLVANAILTEKYHSEWSETLHQEQLASALYTLSPLYLTSSTAHAHMAEMLAYRILLHIDNAQAVSTFLVSLPTQTLSWPPIFKALRLFTSFQRDDYVLYGKLVSQSTLLERALLLKHSVKVFQRAFQIMSKAYNKQSIPIHQVLEFLHVLDQETLHHICHSLNIKVSTSIHFEIVTQYRESREAIKSHAKYCTWKLENSAEMIVKT